MNPSFRFLAIFLITSFTLSEARQITFPEPLSERIASYRISVTLDAEKKMLLGKESLTWTNTSKDRITELQFHLYWNAFKNTKTTFMKESGGQHRGASIGADGWGWIDVTSISIRDGEDLKSRMEFIRPDDGNDMDETVFRVPLARPVRPRQSVTVDIDFTSKIPTIFARTGFNEKFFMIGQWFPKIGVYEPAGMRYATEGQWNCHQFHSNTEFYADYGVYDVDITVPKSFVVGATGLLQNDRENANGTKTHFYHAEDVHDFSWTASPLYKVVEDQWQHVKIRLLIQPDREKSNGHRYMHSAKAALQYFNDHVGKYPYPNLTIVDPQWGALGAGGMEYPTLITGGSFWGLGEGFRVVEGVTIHEFGHEYWYGLVGNNEFEEAWLDEGINQYYETRIMDATYGKKTSFIDFFGYHMGDAEFTRSNYTTMNNPKVSPTYLNAWEYKAGGYGTLTYQKTATFMTTLERLIGPAVMDEAMKTYFERWKFKHPCSRDFISVIDEIVEKRHGDKFGKSMQWFFDQVLYGTDVCDYELTSLGSQRVEGTRGVVDSAGKRITPREKYGPKKVDTFESHVLVSRLGEVKMPVDVLVHFDNGTEVREHWDGLARWKQFEYVRPERILWAKVDPDEVLTIDLNLNNNSKTTEPVSQPIWKYSLKFLFWIQNTLQYTSWF